MRKLAVAAMLFPLLAAGPALADSPERVLGNVQRYGGLWRYQKRDWSHYNCYANPGVSWTWNDQRGDWVWTC
jgi:hypothetical protein